MAARSGPISAATAALLLLTAAALLAACSSATSSASGGAEQLVATRCTMCHSRERIDDALYDKAAWTETVSRMQDNGLVVTPEEKAAIIDYLARRDAAR